MGVLARLSKAVAAAALLALPAMAADAPNLEYPIKATFLEKFGEFVTWPADALSAGAEPFSICILGEDPFGAAIDQAMRAGAVNGHPLALRRLQAAGDAAQCHILYIGRSVATDAVLRELTGQPVLTVTDGAVWSGEPKGIIHFVVRDNRVRFTIDEAAAATNRLGISSKLLGVAIAVNPRGRAP